MNVFHCLIPYNAGELRITHESSCGTKILQKGNEHEKKKNLSLLMIVKDCLFRYRKPKTWLKVLLELIKINYFIGKT